MKLVKIIRVNRNNSKCTKFVRNEGFFVVVSGKKVIVSQIRITGYFRMRQRKNTGQNLSGYRES